MKQPLNDTEGVIKLGFCGSILGFCASIMVWLFFRFVSSMRETLEEEQHRLLKEISEDIEVFIASSKEERG